MVLWDSREGRKKKLDTHAQNHYLECLYERRDGGMADTPIAFIAMAWINSMMSLQAAATASVYLLVTISLYFFFPTVFSFLLLDLSYFPSDSSDNPI